MIMTALSNNPPSLEAKKERSLNQLQSLPGGAYASGNPLDAQP